MKAACDGRLRAVAAAARAVALEQVLVVVVEEEEEEGRVIVHSWSRGTFTLDTAWT